MSMKRVVPECSVPACVLLIFAASTAFADESSGWQGMRVIHQDGSPRHMVAADTDGDGRDELLVVNSRQARIDLLRWQEPARRSGAAGGAAGGAAVGDPERPNELALAPEWSREEIPFDEIPHDVIVDDVDGDGDIEWLVVSSSSSKLQLFRRDASGALKKERSWDLLPATLSGRAPMLLRRRDGGAAEVLLSCENGIQSVRLAPESRATWLQPRESRGRHDWRLADLDGDGDQDLIEWGTQARQSVRWFPQVFGELQPPQVIFDQAIQGFDVITPAGRGAELLLLGVTQQGVLRRYQFARGVQTPVGRQTSLPLAGGKKLLWTGVRLDGRPNLVAVDSAQPRLRVYPLAADGWKSEESFPIVAGVKMIAAPRAADANASGTLLLWVKDARDLHQSRWQSGRFTYPEPAPFGAEAEDRKILALDSVAGHVWWAQKSGDHLDLYTWEPAAAEPVRTRFADLGKDADRVLWAGGKRVIVQKTYGGAVKFAAVDAAGAQSVSEPPQLVKVDLGEFRLCPAEGGVLRLARTTDGVVQWIGEDAEPKDQIMLNDGVRIAAFHSEEEGRAGLALESGGGFVHRLRADASGVLRATESYKISGGLDLIADPVLGLVLVDQERIVHLAEGEPIELKLVDSIDNREGRPTGVKETAIHRIFAGEFTGDRQDDILLCDDRRHQLTLVTIGEKGMKAALSWQVFEDMSYPYGGVEDDNLEHEPRFVLGFTADGDRHRDFAMLCHDRVLVYLGREEGK